VGDIDFKVISAAEIQINSKKPGFGRKNQLKVVTLEGLPFISSIYPFIFGCSKNQYTHCKTMYTC
jgi:hypothetical protein